MKTPKPTAAKKPAAPQSSPLPGSYECPVPHYHGAHTVECRGPRRYEALPNDANDKRPNTYKVCMTWTDERGHHAQKFAQEVYRKDHAEQIAKAMNQGQAFEAMVEAIHDEEEKVQKGRDFILNIKCSCSGEGAGTPGECDRCRALGYLSTHGWDFSAALKLAQEAR